MELQLFHDLERKPAETLEPQSLPRVKRWSRFNKIPCPYPRPIGCILLESREYLCFRKSPLLVHHLTGVNVAFLASIRMPPPRIKGEPQNSSCSWKDSPLPPTSLKTHSYLPLSALGQSELLSLWPNFHRQETILPTTPTYRYLLPPKSWLPSISLFLAPNSLSLSDTTPL